MSKKDTTWECQPHTKAKHKILQSYLQAWFPIISKYSDSVLYIDGYAGPGEYSSGEIGSPLIALNTAIEQKQHLIGTTVQFLFVEKDAQRLSNLESKAKAVQRPTNFNLTFDNRDFVDVLNEGLDTLDSKGVNKASIFAFIDPFGFKSVPYATLRRLLNKEKTEAFIYFDRNSAIRFLTVDKVAARWESLFGIDVPTIFEQNADETKRSEIVKNAYYSQLKGAAKYVGYFTMMSTKNKPLYDLFFVSNSSTGYLKMKAAMWRVDETGGFTFRYSNGDGQTFLFANDYIQKVKEHILDKYNLSQKVLLDAIETDIIENTIYLPKHMRKALRELENEGKIKIESNKVNENKRKKGTFPEGVIINF